MQQLIPYLAFDGNCAEVTMAWGGTFWAGGFGMLVDQYGCPWIVNGEMVPVATPQGTG